MLFVIRCLLQILILTCLGSLTVVQAATELSSADCVKCHPAQVKVVTNFGGPHASQIECLDCHLQHPPLEPPATAGCTECHDGEDHYQIDNCRQCHADPHQPLASLRDPLKPARKECLSCHPQIGELMEAQPSEHAKLFCSHCHEHHQQSPSCLDCHEPHSSNQATEDCQLCHPAHQPLKIVPTGYVPAKFCHTCHSQEGRDLAATNTNHRGINCVSCHQGKHPSTPRCQDCHGLPHAQEIHSQFKDCLECHGDAHRLISNR